MSRSLADARSRVLALETVAELRVVLDDIYEETAIRHLAAQRLGHFGDTGRVALQEAFAAAKENPPGRVAALQALVRYFPKESEATFLEALDDLWPRVRRSARLLLKCFREHFRPEVRLASRLPSELRHHPQARIGALDGLTSREQISVLYAIGQARYTPILPNLVTRLQRFPQSNTWESSFQRVVLLGTIQALGDEAVPLLLDALPKTYVANQYDLLNALAGIKGPVAEAALTTLELPLNQRAVERVQAWRKEWAQARSKRGQRRWEYIPLRQQQPPLRTEFPNGYRECMETLAQDHQLSYTQRQRAHDLLELWRRYNGRGKR